MSSKLLNENTMLFISHLNVIWNIYEMKNQQNESYGQTRMVQV